MISQWNKMNILEQENQIITIMKSIYNILNKIILKILHMLEDN